MGSASLPFGGIGHLSTASQLIPFDSPFGQIIISPIVLTLISVFFLCGGFPKMLGLAYSKKTKWRGGPPLADPRLGAVT